MIVVKRKRSDNLTMNNDYGEENFVNPSYQH